jgi:phage-related protein (TIGR01555 family)
MAKNKHRAAVVNRTDGAGEQLNKAVAIQKSFNATNSLQEALRLGECNVDFTQPSLQSMNGYNNIATQIITLQQYLLTYLYKTYGILGKIIDIPVDDAYKGGGFTLDADSIDEDDVKDLTDAITRYQDIEKIKTARKWARLFGGGALIAITGKDLKEPLNVKQGDELEFMAVDRWQLAYSLPNVMMRGGFWSLTQYESREFDANQAIHPSRVFPVHGKPSPYLISQQVQGWGLSVYEQIFQDMSTFFKSRNALFELIDEAKTDILKLSTLQTALTNDTSMNALQRMVDFIARNKNYKSQITIPTTDDYDQKQISFGGLGEILKEIRIMIAGSANMPVNKIWGEGVTGFGSGEDSLENYNSQIENEIRTPDDPVIEWVLKLRCQQLFGREIEDLVKTWKNLRVLSAIDEQNIHDKKLANVLQLFDRQLLTPQETMEYLKKQQIFIHDTKALKGELEDMPLLNKTDDFSEQKDIVKE